MDFDAVIIGAGVVGLATAKSLTQRGITNILVVDPNESVTSARNQSVANSQVIHAGVYYGKTQPNKARHCVEGNKLTYAFAQEHLVPHLQTGKLILATNDIDRTHLDDVVRKAQANGVPFEMLTPDEVKRKEPNVICTSAAYFPTSGVIDAPEFLKKLQRDTEQRNAMYVFRTKATTITNIPGGYQIRMISDRRSISIDTGFVFNCTGISAPDIARLINPDCPYTTEALRGESAKWYRTNATDATMNLYPPPCFLDESGNKVHATYEECLEQIARGRPLVPSVGVHVTPTVEEKERTFIIGQMITLGPASVRGIDPDDWTQTYDPEHYVRAVQDFLPSITSRKVTLHQAGVQARLKETTDFVLDQYERSVHLLGIDSPGLTAALSLGREAAERYER